MATNGHVDVLDTLQFTATPGKRKGSTYYVHESDDVVVAYVKDGSKQKTRLYLKCVVGVCKGRGSMNVSTLKGRVTKAHDAPCCPSETRHIIDSVRAQAEALGEAGRSTGRTTEAIALDVEKRYI
jgi:hypothetical protein